MARGENQGKQAIIKSGNFVYSSQMLKGKFQIKIDFESMWCK